MADIPVIDPSDDGSSPPLPLSREVVASLRPFRSSGAPTPAQPAAAQPRLVPIAEEVIEIAPHPTINRYPWTPIENPRLPVMPQQAPVAAAAPEPVPQPAYNQPAHQPRPVVVESVPEPLPPQPVLVAQPVPPPVAPPIVVAPPKPVLMPTPQAGAVRAPDPVPAPQPIAIVAQPEPDVPAMLAEDPAPEPVPMPRPKAYERMPVTVYSESTRQAWRVIKPNKLIRAMVICAVLAIVGLAVFFWMSMGRPTSADKVPVLHHILQSE